MKKLLPLISLLALLACGGEIVNIPQASSTLEETAVPLPTPSEPLPYPAIEAKVGRVVARLTVPRLGMYNYPVRMGVSAAVLAYGPGVYKGTPEPGEGNFTLAGHRVTPVGPWDHGPFRYLDTLVPGDIAKVLYKGKVYRYEFWRTIIVLPDNVNVLRDEKADMTFTACHPPGYATERIVAQWRLV